MTTDEILLNGYPVCFYVEYRKMHDREAPSWISSTNAGGPYYSTRELNLALPEIIEKCPKYWEVHIELQERE